MSIQNAPNEIGTVARSASEGFEQSAPRSRVGLLLLSRLRWIIHLPSRLIILFVRGYQVTLSPLLGNRCRFHPSCSQYFIEAVRKYGAIRGAAKGVWRLARCHPFNPGGYDPP